MKRTLLLILALCLLLTGCGVPGGTDTQSSDTSEELSTTAETTTEPIKEARRSLIRARHLTTAALFGTFPINRLRRSSIQCFAPSQVIF